MEIHAPHEPVHSWRDLLIHLAIVTVGILIALSLEQATEWFRHRAIVREAQENILNELRDNKASVDKALANMDANLAGQEKALQAVMDLLAHKKLKATELSIAFTGPSASSTSWRAAEAIGALSLMDYPTLKKYAGIYQTQSEYMRIQERTEDTVIAATTYFHGADFEKESARDLDESRRQLLASITAARVQLQVARQLSAEYGKVLGNRE